MFWESLDQFVLMIWLVKYLIVVQTFPKFKIIYGYLKSIFKLNKPSNGYGIKYLPVTKGGAWGYRSEGLDSILSKMI